MYKIFIDGSAGTTGLRIFERLGARDDISLITLSDELRKNTDARREAMAKSDVTFLCLPDDAAREAVTLCDDTDTVIIDCSTAHRTDPMWAYGFPELSEEFASKIASSKRIANPGCHASGCCAILYPLVASGVVSADHPAVFHSLTGYSGGGKKMIADYESEERSARLSSPCEYALGGNHKHLPEIKKVCGLNFAPAFNPIVSDFYSGMCVTFPLITRLASRELSAEDVHDIFAEHYAGSKIIKVAPYIAGGTPDGKIFSNTYSGYDSMEIIVCGSEETINIYACFCNLGKGASGAAIQNMNIALGLPQEKGLVL